ncbi:MAG: thioredoxin [Candidatus Pacebacteria bacterium]|nr:thioredoxin [Candidatus Paceibacterota bacterium]
MSKIIELTHATFEDEVLRSDIPVLVDFWAPWCGPCCMMAPILKELAEELEGKIKITKLNTDVTEHQKIASEYKIQSIPNMKLFKSGEAIKDFVGFRPKEMFKQELEAEL